MKDLGYHAVGQNRFGEMLSCRNKRILIDRSCKDVGFLYWPTQLFWLTVAMLIVVVVLVPLSSHVVLQWNQYWNLSTIRCRFLKHKLLIHYVYKLVKTDLRGSHASWNSVCKTSRTWKGLENEFGPGNSRSWNLLGNDADGGCQNMCIRSW